LPSRWSACRSTLPPAAPRNSPAPASSSTTPTPSSNRTTCGPTARQAFPPHGRDAVCCPPMPQDKGAQGTMAMSKRYAMAMGSELARGITMSAANWAWRASVALPVVAFFLAVGTSAIGGGTGEAGGWGLIFLLVALLWLALVVPPIYVLRSHC